MNSSIEDVPTELQESFSTSFLLQESNYTVSNETNITNTDSPKCYSGINVTASNLPPCENVNSYHNYIIVAIVISIICLFIIFYVYSTITEFKNLHGKILLSLSGCLTITYIFLILDFILRKIVPLSGCIAIGIIIHISFLATFFWTNIMAYDAWRTISRIRANTEIRQRQRYLMYAIYAWASTILVSLPAIVLDNVNLLQPKHRPNFGLKRCWLSGKLAFYFYFNGPVGIILLINLIMFILTTKTLLQVKNATMILKIKKDRNRFHLYIKLFLIMGLTWATQFLPWITGIYELYALAGLLTCLHGLYLFLIFICKRKVYQHLRKHWAKSSNTKGSSSGTNKPTFESYLKSSSSTDNIKTLKVTTIM